MFQISNIFVSGERVCLNEGQAPVQRDVISPKMQQTPLWSFGNVRINHTLETEIVIGSRKERTPQWHTQMSGGSHTRTAQKNAHKRRDIEATPAAVAAASSGGRQSEEACKQARRARGVTRDSKEEGSVTSLQPFRGTVTKSVSLSEYWPRQTRPVDWCR